jgi:hypothetical protein
MKLCKKLWKKRGKSFVLNKSYRIKEIIKEESPRKSKRMKI